MFGFMEGAYETIWTGRIVHAGNEVDVDIRRPLPPPEVQMMLTKKELKPSQQERVLQEKEFYESKGSYLVLMLNGSPMYLFYDRPNQSKDVGNGQLADDLERLTAHPDLRLNDLQWYEKVYCDTGYGRDGSITMY